MLGERLPTTVRPITVTAALQTAFPASIVIPRSRFDNDKCVSRIIVYNGGRLHQWIAGRAIIGRAPLRVGQVAGSVQNRVWKECVTSLARESDTPVQWPGRCRSELCLVGRRVSCTGVLSPVRQFCLMCSICVWRLSDVSDVCLMCLTCVPCLTGVLRDGPAAGAPPAQCMCHRL